MPAILVVEDGSGVADANTYITVEEAKKYASDRGVTLGTDEQISANLVLAADYIETDGPFKLKPFSQTQGLEFPRKEFYTNASLGVPSKVKKAQAQLLVDIKESGALLTTKRQFALKRRKLEGLEQEWAVGANALYAAKAVHTVYDHLMSGFKTYGATGGYLYR